MIQSGDSSRFEIKYYCDQISTLSICIGANFVNGKSSEEETKLELENICNKVQNIIRIIDKDKYDN